MQITINVNKPRVYFITYDNNKCKFVQRTGFYVSQTKGESDKSYEVQGTHCLYTNICRNDFFGTNKAKAIAECDRRNELDE